jgi:hypothetical protein
VISVRAWVLVVFIIIAAGMIVAACAVLLRMPGRSHRGTPPLMTAAQRALRDEIQRDVQTLAGDIGERNMLSAPEAYGRAADFIERAFAEAGYTPRRQTFEVDGVPCANVEAEVPGGEEIVVVGAHYDTVVGSPGADDNASGVAAMLAIARRLAHESPERTVRFVAFANEEPPHFTTPGMGSWQYAKRCHDRDEKIVAMLSVEAIGYFSDAPYSQQYPAMLHTVYPSTGNFMAFVSNLGSRGLLQRCVEVFRRSAAVPSEGAALPEEIPGVGWSDQWSFWRFDVPAVMITDTAPFRNPHYHGPDDRPETLDYERLARVAEGLVEVVRALSFRT